MRVKESLHAPHLLDLEVTQVLRRFVQQGILNASRADEALRDLLDLRIYRYPHSLFVPRIWQLRHNLSAYDAAYVALAEALGGVLITRDQGLATAARHGAAVEVYLSVQNPANVIEITSVCDSHCRARNAFALQYP